MCRGHPSLCAMWRLAHRDARASANSDAEVVVAPVMQLCHVNVWPGVGLRVGVAGLHQAGLHCSVGFAEVSHGSTMVRLQQSQTAVPLIPHQRLQNGAVPDRGPDPDG